MADHSGLSSSEANSAPYDVPREMRALVLSGTGFEHLAVKKVPTPHPGSFQLLARVEAAGICTSLIKLIEQGPNHKLMYGWDISQFPLILGDEGAVTIIRVGEKLRENYCPGEHYVIQPAVDHAPINYRERYHDGAKGVRKLGVGYTLAGHLAEYILITEEILESGCLLPMPDAQVPFAHAAMSEPLSCALSAQEHHMHLVQENPLAPRQVIKGLKPQGVTVVIGAGAMGRMHVDMALSYRPRAILVVDFVESRLETVARLFGPKAKEAGINLQTVNAGSEQVEGVVGELTQYAGADDVIVAVGSAKAIETSQRIVGRGAVLNLFGGLKKGEDIVGVDAGVVHYKEINLTGSSGGSPWDVARVLDLIATHEIDPGAHIARVGDLDHVVDLLDMVKAQRIDGKAVVYPHRRTTNIRSVSHWSAEDESNYLQQGAI
ncbi:MAG: zinc-binding dehydrogenase [Acidobacteriia bacterium]|nr:zinc-binding dehydrogenase [Terriglobia bacterium]